MRSTLALAFSTVLLGILVACSADESADVDAVDAGDGAAPEVDAAAAEDAGVAEAAEAGTGQSHTTALDATISGVTRTLDRGQFGTDKGDAGESLYIEAHEGGEPGCPTSSSPSPNRTVIVSGLPVGAAGEVFTKADGVAVSFLDFAGDQMPGKPVTKASSATVTIVAIDEGVSVTLDLDATFAEGTVKGRIYAGYCASLSQ